MATISISTAMFAKPTSPRLRLNRSQSVKALSVRSSGEAIAREFDPKLRIEEAVTPPSSWYTHSDFLSLEIPRVFHSGWQVVGCSEQIKEPRDFFTGRLENLEFVVCRDDNGEVRAFHNVCRHHAMILADGNGKKSCFVCPYHGWTYGLDGSFRKATMMTGIKNFDVNDYGLYPIQVAVLGQLVLINMEEGVNDEVSVVENEWLGSSSEILHNILVDSSLSYICRREYTIECNWKDIMFHGGYHVPYVHKDLAGGLKLDSYSTTIFEKVSIQKCEGGSMEGKADFDRLGSTALYAFVYPNFMINRYGPWMDTNLVIPLGPRKCRVVFDYFLEAAYKDDQAFIDRSLKDSERVQMEDVMICEKVQRGLESPVYSVGRYAPAVERAMHHFHCLLHSRLTK